MQSSTDNMRCAICSEPCTAANFVDPRISVDLHLCRWDVASVLRKEWHDLVSLRSSLLTPGELRPEMRDRAEIFGKHCYACNEVQGLEQFEIRIKGFKLFLMACTKHHCAQEFSKDRKETAWENLPENLFEDLPEEQEEKRCEYAGGMAEIWDTFARDLANKLRAVSVGEENDSLEVVEAITKRAEESLSACTTQD